MSGARLSPAASVASLDDARRRRTLARLAADEAPVPASPRSDVLRAAALLTRAALAETTSSGNRSHLLGLADEAQRVAEGM